MARRPRASAQVAATLIRTPTPQNFESSDGDALDGSSSGPATPLGTDTLEQVERTTKEDEDEDDLGSPTNDLEALSHGWVNSRGKSSVSRKRRAGRPPKFRTQEWGGPEEVESRDTGSDIGTPRKRGGWRGRGFGAGRWGKPRGGPSHITQVPLDKEGNMANVKDDEVELPEDPEGETKVDKMGNLLGDREYRVRVFTISGKGNRLYMLSTEPARCIGFRDSYLFFQKHRQLYKIILAEEAKRDLIERNIIPHSYKGRAIGVVTARSVFREFGARIVIGGRKIIDDYQVATARANGDVEGDFAVPEDTLPGGVDTYDRNQYVAWHGASSVYHSGTPSAPLPGGRIMDGKKRKVIMTGVNWMFEHAREASRFNSVLAHNRLGNLRGVYDIHTNSMQYPKTMQPTHARFEQLQSSPETSGALQMALVEPNRDDAGENDSRYKDEEQKLDKAEGKEGTIFPNVACVFSRNFLISDVLYVSPLLPDPGYPGPDGQVVDTGPDSLTQISAQILAELPTDCREAFNEACSKELMWKTRWGSERDDRAQARLRISYNT